MRHALAAQFDADAIYPLPDERDDPYAHTDVDRLRTVFEARGDQIQVVTGHFPFCVTELLGVPFKSFTILREPVDRTLSHLRYQRLVDDLYADKSFLDAYSVPTNLFGNLLNQMVKTLGMSASENTAGVWSFLPCTDEHLERAKAALDSMAVVGVQSDFGGFLADLKDAFGWDLGEPVRTNETDPTGVDGSFLELVASDNYLDSALYEYAVELVAKRGRRLVERSA